jgi:DNA-binding MarR family transcriptional regulator
MERGAFPRIHDLDNQTGVLPVLIYLYDHGPAPKTAISRLLMYRHETIGKTLEVLSRFGLVAGRRDAWFPYRHAFELTPLGRKLVETPIHGWPLLLDQILSLTAS